MQGECAVVIVNGRDQIDSLYQPLQWAGAVRVDGGIFSMKERSKIVHVNALVR